MTIVDEIVEERRRQQEKHGRDEYAAPHDWIAWIAKHAGLAALREEDTMGAAIDRFRKQMVIVAALAVAAIEWTDHEIATLVEESNGKREHPDKKAADDS